MDGFWWYSPGLLRKADVFETGVQNFVEFKGVRLWRDELEQISRLYNGNLYNGNVMKYFKKFVLRPFGLSSLYVQIYPEDFVHKMSRLLPSLHIQTCFNAKTRNRYRRDRVRALNLLKQYLETYWTRISDEAKKKLKDCVVSIFTTEEIVCFEVYEAAYEFMQSVSLTENAQIWISLEEMLKDQSKPAVQLFGLRFLQFTPIEEKEELFQKFFQDVKLVEVGLLDGPPELRLAILQIAVKYIKFMDTELAPKLLESVYHNFINKADWEAKLSVALIEDLMTREADSSNNVFCSKPFLEATVNFIFPLAKSKLVHHRVMRRWGYNMIKLIVVISLDANDPYFFNEVMEWCHNMMIYYDGELTWEMSPTLSPTTGHESDYDMGRRYAYGLIQHLHQARPSFFGRIEKYLLDKVEKWIVLSSYRDQHAAVETCAMLKPRLTRVECPKSCTTCPIARRLSVIIKALESKKSRVQWAGASYLRDLLKLIGSDHNMKDDLRTLLSNLRRTSQLDDVQGCALEALEALDA